MRSIWEFFPFVVGSFFSTHICLMEQKVYVNLFRKAREDLYSIFLSLLKARKTNKQNKYQIYIICHGNFFKNVVLDEIE